MTPQDEKRAAARAAAQFVEAGMTVGLGSGSTAAVFVEALAARRLDIRTVATSTSTEASARERGMTVVDLDEAETIDLTIDGADQIGPDLALIKGGGAALLREKLVWMASARRIVIADASKLASPFGRFPLPIEVVAFGHLSTARRIDAALADLGIPARAAVREIDGAPVRTDGGNLIYDAPCGALAHPAAVADALKAVTGVVEHGLFLGLAERALIGAAGGVETIWP